MMITIAVLFLVISLGCTRPQFYNRERYGINGNSRYSYGDSGYSYGDSGYSYGDSGYSYGDSGYSYNRNSGSFSNGNLGSFYSGNSGSSSSNGNGSKGSNKPNVGVEIPCEDCDYVADRVLHENIDFGKTTESYPGRIAGTIIKTEEFGYGKGKVNADRLSKTQRQSFNLSPGGTTSLDVNFGGEFDHNTYGINQQASAGVSINQQIGKAKVEVGYGVGAGVNAGYNANERNVGLGVTTPVGGFGAKVGCTTEVCVFACVKVKVC